MDHGPGPGAQPRFTSMVCDMDSAARRLAACPRLDDSFFERALFAGALGIDALVESMGAECPDARGGDSSAHHGVDDGDANAADERRAVGVSEFTSDYDYELP